MPHRNLLLDAASTQDLPTPREYLGESPERSDRRRWRRKCCRTTARLRRPLNEIRNWFAHEHLRRITEGRKNKWRYRPPIEHLVLLARSGRLSENFDTKTCA